MANLKAKEYRQFTHDFAEVSKIVEAGAASKSIKDYEFTSFIVSKNRLTILKLGIPKYEGFLI